VRFDSIYLYSTHQASRSRGRKKQAAGKSEEEASSSGLHGLELEWGGRSRQQGRGRRKQQAARAGAAAQ